MGKKLILTISLLAVLLTAKSEKFRIEVKWEGLKDTSIYLAHYFDTNIYVNDTIQLNSKGQGIFEGDSLLPQGLYMLYLNGNNYFDLLIGEKQNIKVKTNNEHLIDSLSISGSEESREFVNYQHYIRRQSTLKNDFLEKLKSENNEEAAGARTQIDSIDNEMKTYIENGIEKSGGNMFGAFLKAANQLDIPEPNFDRAHPQYDSLAWFYAYNYRRDHFLEGVDFTDERLLRTPLLRPKLDVYFNKILIQSPDSLIPQAIKLLRNAEKIPPMYQYLSSFLINNSVQSKIMGMDAVFVALADEVFLSGKAFWADSAQYIKIAEEAYLTRPNLIGKIAPDLEMEDIDGEMETLHQLQSDYTILLFYEYNCGHCKKTIPAIYNDVYMKFLDHNIEVFAVCMNDDKEKWEEFVNEHELVGWHHVWDVDHRSKFRFKYNVKSTPIIYLLDKNKKIIAKKLDNENLIMLLDTLLNRK